MHDHADMIAKQPTAATSSSGFAALDSQMQRQASRNLSILAMFYASVYVVAFLTGWMTHVVGVGAFHFPSPVNSITAIVSVGMSLFVGRKCWDCDTAVTSFTKIAQIYAALAAAGIAMNYWGWEQEFLVDEGLSDSFEVSWVGTWILVFPVISHLDPRRTLRSTLACAATVPAVLLLSLLVNGFPEGAMANAPREASFIVLQLTIPVLICVGIAVYMTRHVFRLARDVTEARRVGSYQLLKKIGEGGMGEVWQAEHRLLARPAAVKLIRPDTLGAEGDDSNAFTARRRFEREARSTALLTSPHTVELYDFGITEDRTFYYVMELLRGVDLKTLVENGGPIPPERAIHFLRQACASLADAHQSGMVHRDIKPGNLYACRRGLEYDFVKVLDFGLVKDVAGRTNGDETQLTMEGVASGTPAFMAPEMALGRRGIDGRADIYALGCVAYWLLTGQLVFETETPMETLVHHVREEPPRLSDRTEVPIDSGLEGIVLDCLAKSPRDRPATAQLLSSRLAEVEERLGVWTQDRAERWWRAHLPRFVASPAAPPLMAAMPVGAK